MSTLAIPGEVTKVCSRCSEPRDVEDFAVKKRWPDGRVRYRESRCGECRRELDRARARRLSEARGTRRQFRNQAPVDAEPVPRLPIAPLRAWLREREREFADRTAMAAWMGVNEKRIREWLNENQFVLLDTIDRVAVQIDDPWLLRELWPELYVFGA